MNCTVCITDKDQIIAAAGSGRKELQEKYIQKELAELLEERECVLLRKQDKSFVVIADGAEEYGTEEVINPILCEGDVIGSVIFLKKEEKRRFGEVEQKVAMSAAAFLGKQMEQ